MSDTGPAGRSGASARRRSRSGGAVASMNSTRRWGSQFGPGPGPGPGRNRCVGDQVREEWRCSGNSSSRGTFYHRGRLPARERRPSSRKGRRRWAGYTVHRFLFLSDDVGLFGAFGPRVGCWWFSACWGLAGPWCSGLTGHSRKESSAGQAWVDVGRMSLLLGFREGPVGVYETPICAVDLGKDLSSWLSPHILVFCPPPSTEPCLAVPKRGFVDVDA